MSRVQGLADLGDLEIGPSILKKPLTNKEFVRLSSDSQMAENALVTVNHGIAAIGSMLAGIGSNDVGGDGSGPVNQDIIDAEALQDIGYLLEGLGNLSHQLSNTINYIGDKKTQQAALTGKYD